MALTPLFLLAAGAHYAAARSIRREATGEALIDG
jgi:hypothetical protein